MRVLFVIATLFVAISTAENEEPLPSLEGMQALTISCKNPVQSLLVQSYVGVPGFEFLRVTYDSMDVLVAANQAGKFKEVLDANQISYTVTIQNLKDLVVEEHITQQVERRLNYRSYSPFNKLSFTYYPDYQEINAYLNHVASNYKNVATLVDIGSSFEGRSMKALKISTGGKNKPGVFIDAGIHAREWIAPITALYIIDQLVGNKTNSHLLEHVDWYIVPLVNPDGYQFTHSNPANRLWRKTRSINKGSVCRGVDGNRNFDIAWMTIGASSWPCSDTYAGAAPFSEKETVNVRDFMLAQNGSAKIYISLHSYGQYILYPWGYTSELPANELELRSLASTCARAIGSVRRTRYTFGTSANHLYPSAGGSDDWAMDKGGADLAYTYELPGGAAGFILPPSEIIPVGTETFEAIKEVHKYTKSRYLIF